MDAFCILFADTFKKQDIGGFAKNRTISSLHVGCRYRLVDFMLSSLVKANVPNIGILTTTNYNSLMDHVGWGKDWDLNRKNSGLKILTPLSIADTVVPKNKFEALINAQAYIESMLQDYCILADANIVCNIDFKEALEYHKRNNADITVFTRRSRPQPKEIEMVLDEKNRAYDSLYHPQGSDSECNTLFKVTILHKELLLKIIQKGNTLGWEDIVGDYISKNFNKLNVYAYKVDGYCRIVDSLDSYYELNMDLLNEEISKEIFLSGTEILTRIKDSVPTVYGKKAEVKNCLLADGSHINGKVENSIVFRDVLIEDGAEVKNSIIMSGTVVKSGAKLDYVIADKGVVVSKNKMLKGDKNCQFSIPKNKVI